MQRSQGAVSYSVPERDKVSAEILSECLTSSTSGSKEASRREKDYPSSFPDTPVFLSLFRYSSESREAVIKKITHKNRIIAIIIESSYRNDGITFFTPDDFSQQLAYMKRPLGYQIAPHIHKEVNRNVQHTQEVLFIKKGKIKVDLYTHEKAYLESTILESGDVILLASGGHGFTMLEESEMIEVKQGPYAGDEDKERF